MIELLAPAGSFESLSAAIKAKADAVYFGIGFLNMRAGGAKNFSLEEMPKVVKQCHSSKVKAYLALNSVIFDSDLPLMNEILEKAAKAKVDAVIVSDLAVIRKARELGLEVHISTQQNIANFEALKFFSQFTDRVVLARELNLGQIKNIKEKIIAENVKGPNGRLIEIECFVHGALCVAVSGRCFMSHFTSGKSANRGECVQNCRRAYNVTDDEGNKLKIENHFIMSPEDLSTIDFVDKLVEAGIDVFKIEGRARSADYVFETVNAYREALNAIQENRYSFELKKELHSRLERVYNRGFSSGHFLGQPLDSWSATYGSKATEQKRYIGVVKKFYRKISVAEILLEAGNLELNQDVMITGDTTGFFRQKVESIQVSNEAIQSAKKGALIALKVNERVRENDKLFVIEKPLHENNTHQLIQIDW